jgi:two-component system sensor histidine kinase ArlS
VKLKITILSAIILCGILFVLDGFIYFTLFNRLENFSKENINSKTRLIAQDYVDYISEEPNPKDRKIQLNNWLSQYSQEGQSVGIISPSNQILAYKGEFPANEIKRYLILFPTPVTKKVEIRNKPVMWSFFPVRKSGRLLGYIILLEDMSNLSKYMDSLLAVLIMGSIGAIFLSALGGYIISSTAVRPINQMISLVERIQADRLSERLSIPNGQDEIARLALTFNHMLDRIERSFEQQSRFVANASHEIRTPLTTIQGYANLLSRWGKNDPAILEKAIRVIQNESARLRDLANNLLTLASLEFYTNRVNEKASVDPIMEEIVESFAPLHPDISIFYDSGTHPTVAVAPDHLKQMIINVLDNAIKYTPSGGKVKIEIFTKHPYVVIEITDSGKGIPREDLPYITERFYRVEKSRGRRQGGAGLGLAIVNELINFYNGSFSIDSEVGKGTRVTIALPAVS